MKENSKSSKTKTIIIAFSAILALLPIHTAMIPLVEAQERGLVYVESKNANSAGRYYALVIGNNDYQHLGKLETAVSDAEEVEKVLRDVYGFETRLLLNASRSQALMALNEYRRKLDASSNLLIYYAGHGEYDTQVEKAYWLPVDARPDDNVAWISADDVTTNIKGVSSRHVLIISDSCYSGMIQRYGNVNLKSVERERYLQKMMEGRSRILMSSGGNEPVADQGGAGHSVFARALLRGLTEMDKSVFTGEELFYEFIRESVAGKSNQTPQYNPISNSGHDSGDFVFTRTADKKKTQPPDSTTTETQLGEATKDSDNPEENKAYPEQRPDGSSAPLADIKAYPEPPPGIRPAKEESVPLRAPSPPPLQQKLPPPPLLQKKVKQPVKRVGRRPL